jgi:hypothetical protein
VEDVLRDVLSDAANVVTVVVVVAVVPMTLSAGAAVLGRVSDKEAFASTATQNLKKGPSPEIRGWHAQACRRHWVLTCRDISTAQREDARRCGIK